MPTLSAPKSEPSNRAARRAQRRARRESPPPPPSKPNAYVVVSATVAAPPPDLDALSPDLLLSREMAYAECAAIKLETWLNDRLYDGRTCSYQREAIVCQRCPGKMCPLSTCVIGATLVPILLEAWLKFAILFPELLPRAAAEDDDEPEMIINKGDAASIGLCVVRKRPGKHKPVPTLPGCRGVDEDGEACAKLRRFGAKYCPHHEKAERERMREDAA